MNQYKIRSRNVLLIAGVATLGLWLAVGKASAAEPFEAFLDGLRDRGLYDVAMMYLDEMRTSNLVSADTRSIIPYEEGRTLVDQARDEQDVNQKTKQLEAASEKLDLFIKSNSAHPMVGAASMQRGNVIVERGRMALDAAGRPSNSKQKDALLKQARDLFDSAEKVFTEAETKFESDLEKFPKFIPDTETKQIAARDQARRDVIQAMLYAGAVLAERAKTFAANSPEAKKALQVAADKYQKVYERFRNRLAGLLARIKQGQCYQEMGDARRALGLYADILGQPDDEEFRKLKASALYLSLECWLKDSEKRYELAGLKGEEWLNKARGTEDRQPDWLAIRYYTALSEVMQAESLDPKDAATANKKKTLLAAAREHANQVAKLPGVYKDAAKALIPRTGGADVANKEPTNFMEALERGRVAMDEMSAKQQQIRVAPELGPEAVKSVPQYQQEAADLRQKAMTYFDLALKLRDETVPVDEINNVRYYLCFLNYQVKKFYEAAVLGEFLATRYPSSGGARQGAKIALACFYESYRDPALAATKEFDFQKMVEVAEYMTRRWKDEAETNDAWAILLAINVGEHRIKEAFECLAKIPESSPMRADQELKLGQSCWREYLLAQQKEEGSSERLPQAELDKLVAQAAEMLESGMNRMRANVEAGGAVTLDLTAAALSAAQIYLGSGKPEKAVALLEDPKIGPLTLYTAKNPIVLQHDIPIEVHKAALRAYVGASQLPKAEKMMNDLETLVKTQSGTAAQADLTKIFISMGRALEEQMTALRRDNKTDELAKVAKGFELFLERISGREQGNTFGSLNWVSETFYSLGAGYDSGAQTTPPEAMAYYQKTLDTDNRIMATAAKDASFAPNADALVAIKLRTARCLRRMKKFGEAMDLLAGNTEKKVQGVLQVKPQLLDAQAEAAQVLMDRAAVDNHLYYKSAIIGSRPQKTLPGQPNLVWGWSKLASMVQTNPQFQDAYFDARYNMINCRVLHSQVPANASEKAELLKRAEDDIFLTWRLKPALADGSTPWTAKYDALLRTVQKLSNQKPDGFKAFDKLVAPKKTPTKTSSK